MLLDSFPRPHFAPVSRDSAFGNMRSETLLRRLEPRIMFDGAALVTAVDALHHDGAQVAHTALDTSHHALLLADIASLAAHAHGPAVVQAVANFKQVVFIDAAVQNPAAIEKAAGSNDEIVLLDAGQDGLTQIAQILAGHTGLDAIHIVSHGEAGKLFLGSSVYDATTIKGFDAELGAIGASLHQGGDILLYGCDVAKGAAGDVFIHKIADLTHANVAASTDMTGSAALGGNWTLEDIAGSLHTAVISAADWHGELAALNLTTLSGQTALQFANALFGPGVTVTAASFTGNTNQGASFSNATAAMPNVAAFDSGVIFATGTASSIQGPNNTASYTANNPSGVNNDPQFNAVANGNPTFNDTYLTATITPITNKITVQYVFMSEEYPEFVYSGYNDAMAFIVNGVNAAKVPNGLGVCIDTINNAAGINPAYGSPSLDPNPGHSTTSFTSANPTLFVDNSTGAYNTQADGFTHTITFVANVNAGVANTIKVGIANTGDNAYDSWLMIKANSVESQTIANPESVTTPANVPVTIAPITNVVTTASGPVGIIKIDDMAVAAGGSVTLASGTTVTLNADNTLTLTPDGHTVGTDTFSYLVQDSTGVTALGLGTVTTTAPPPVAGADSFTTAAGTSVVIHELANDSDPGGHAVKVTQVNGLAITAGGLPVPVTGGLVSLAASDDLTFAPAVGYAGTPAFTYTIDDSHGGTATGNVSGTVYAPPVAVADSFATGAGLAVTIPVLVNDTDINGFALTVTKVGSTAITAGGAAVAVTGGSVKLDALGDLIFTPAAGYTGAPSFSYTTSDGHGGTATATVSGYVYALPTPAADTFTTAHDTPVTLSPLANDTDVNGLPLAIVAVNGTLVTAASGPVAVIGGHVTLSLTGDLVFTPNPGYAGTPSFTYAVSDGFGGTATAAITGTVTSASPFLDLSGPTSPAAANLLVNGGIESGSTGWINASVLGLPVPLTYLPGINSPLTSGPAPASTSGGIGVLTSLIGTIGPGHVLLANTTPLNLVQGQLYNFAFDVQSLVSIQPIAPNFNWVILDAANNAVMTVPGKYTTGAAGGDLSAIILSLSSWQTVQSSFVSTLATGTYKLGMSWAAGLGTVGQTLDINLDRIYLAAEPSGFAATFAESGTAVSIADPTALITDTDNAILAAASVVLSNAQTADQLSIGGMVLTNGATGSIGGIGYTVLDTGGQISVAFSGTASKAAYASALEAVAFANTSHNPSSLDRLINISVNDGISSSNISVATIHVVPVNDPPVETAPAALSTNVNTPLAITGLAVSDIDANGGLETVTLAAGSGTLTLGSKAGLVFETGDGTADPVMTFTGSVAQINAAIANVTYSPVAGTIGADSVTFATSDNGNTGGGAQSVTQTVAISVLDVPPIANADSFGVVAGATTNLSVLANDTGVSGFTLGVTAINGTPLSAGGTVTLASGTVLALNANGSIGAAAPVGSFASDSFTYTITDGHGGTATAGAALGVVPTANPVLDLNGSMPFTSAFLYGHNGTGSAPSWHNPVNDATFASVGNEVAGAGLAISYNGSAAIVTGAGSPTLGQAVANNDYISMSFTTTGTMPETWLENTSKYNSNNGATSSSYQFAVAISTDGFKTGKLLSQNNPNIGGAPWNGGNTQYPEQQLANYQLQPGTNYELRAYIYNVAGAAPATVNWDDFYVQASSNPTTFAPTFTEGQPAVAIAAPAIQVVDADSTTLSAASVVLTNEQASDLLKLSGATLTDGTTGSIGGIGYTVHDTGNQISIGFNGTASKAAYASAIGAISFANTSSNPNPADRVIDVTVTDSTGLVSNTAMSTVHVVPVNTAPVEAAPAGQVSGSIGVVLSAATGNGLSVSDVDANGAAESITLSVAHGTVTLSGTSGLTFSQGGGISDPTMTFTGTLADINSAVDGLKYNPTSSYGGPDTLTFASNDLGNTGIGGAKSIAANISLTVYAPPALINDSFAIAAGTPVVFAPLANDSDANGFALTVADVNGAPIVVGTPIAVAGGTVTLDAGGQLTFTPTPGFAGRPNFTYTAADGHGGLATATINGTVWAPPTPYPDGFYTVAGNPVTIGPLANDSDPNGFALTISAIDGHPVVAGSAAIAVTGGTVALGAGGSLTFTPAAGFCGSPSFSYTVTDGHGGQAVATISGKVAAGLDLSQHESAPGRGGDVSDKQSSPTGTTPEAAANEFIHPVAGTDKGDLGSGSTEHIRLVVEGATTKLDQQYGAGPASVPLRTMMGGGRESSSAGANVYEPLADAPFWSGLAPIDFGALPGQAADLGGRYAWGGSTPHAAAISFSQSVALIQGRFDRAARQWGVDLVAVA